jgi:hypothetical protein
VIARLLLPLLALPSLAWAEGPVTVVVAAPKTPALVTATGRVAAELTAAGYLLSSQCAPALDEGCAQAWPTGAPALAAVAFAWATEGLAIEARVARADRRTVRLETLVSGTPAPEPSVVAVRTAELVRAGVLAVMRDPERVEITAPGSAAAAGSARPGRWLPPWRPRWTPARARPSCAAICWGRSWACAGPWRWSSRPSAWAAASIICACAARR